MRRSTVLSLPSQLVFPVLTNGYMYVVTILNLKCTAFPPELEQASLLEAIRLYLLVKMSLKDVICVNVAAPLMQKWTNRGPCCKTFFLRY
jgi:hypothetical protein